MVFDSGDTFVPGFSLLDEQRKDVVATAKFIVDQFNSAGLAAMTLGDRDLLLGADVLNGLAKRAKFPVVATNLVYKKTKAPVFKTTAVVEAAGMKVGVIGLMGSNARLPAESPFAIVDATAAASEAISALVAAEVDLVVVLSHLTDPEQVKLAKAHPRINAILGGGTVKMARQVEREGNTFITNGYSKGKQLSVLRFNVHPGTKPSGFVDRYQNQGLAQQVSELQGRLERYQKILERQKTAPAPAAGRRPTAASSESFYAKQITKLRADKQLAEMQLADAPQVDPKANFVQFELIPLSKTITHEPAVDKAVEAFRRKVPKLDAKAKRLPTRGPLKATPPRRPPSKIPAKR